MYYDLRIYVYISGGFTMSLLIIEHTKISSLHSANELDLIVKDL